MLSLSPERLQGLLAVLAIPLRELSLVEDLLHRCSLDGRPLQEGDRPGGRELTFGGPFYPGLGLRDGGFPRLLLVLGGLDVGYRVDGWLVVHRYRGLR